MILSFSRYSAYGIWNEVGYDDCGGFAGCLNCSWFDQEHRFSFISIRERIVIKAIGQQEVRYHGHLCRRRWRSVVLVEKALHSGDNRQWLVLVLFFPKRNHFRGFTNISDVLWESGDACERIEEAKQKVDDGFYGNGEDRQRDNSRKKRRDSD